MCFTSPPDHQHLHSFPTRRSSDLKRHIDDDHFRAGELADEVQRIARRVVLVRGDEQLVVLVEVERAEKDRKSTRLNSSHVEISYAVFCLKKKRKRRNSEGMYAR